jgi:hypothetical protein
LSGRDLVAVVLGRVVEAFQIAHCLCGRQPRDKSEDGGDQNLAVKDIRRVGGPRLNFRQYIAPTLADVAADLDHDQEKRQLDETESDHVFIHEGHSFEQVV